MRRPKGICDPGVGGNEIFYASEVAANHGVTIPIKRLLCEYKGGWVHADLDSFHNSTGRGNQMRFAREAPGPFARFLT